MVLLILLVVSLLVGGSLALLAGMSGPRVLGPGIAMMAATLFFYGLVALL
ncbi:MAG: hypothetical protein JSV95_01490 [Gemmatimonadota bacterium]|jgi:hypothetical protein|nr:MAG: hypothetical protein JSV95_01490 [Gemmatimonadota bacterium]